MYQPLAPCPSCSRHVKTTEPACPFCQSKLPDDHVDAAIPGATTRLSRAAVFAFSASLAVAGVVVGTTSCTSFTAGSDADGGPPDNGGVDAAYGGPPVRDSGPTDTGSTDTGTADTGPQDEGGVVSAYGLPADAGSD